MWKDRAWSFVTGNNFFLIALGVVAFIVYQRFAQAPSTGPLAGAKPGPVAEAPEPKYVQEIRDRMAALGKPQIVVIPGSNQAIATLPKDELEKKRPGSIAPEVRNDNASNVLDRTEIPPSKGKTQVDAIGRVGQDNVYRVRLDYRQLPPHWYEFKKEYHFGAGYGIAGPNIAEVWAKAQPLRLWNMESYGEVRVGMERDGGRFNGQVTVGVQY